MWNSLPVKNITWVRPEITTAPDWMYQHQRLSRLIALFLLLVAPVCMIISNWHELRKLFTQVYTDLWELVVGKYMYFEEDEDPD